MSVGGLAGPDFRVNISFAAVRESGQDAGRRNAARHKYHNKGKLSREMGYRRISSIYGNISPAKQQHLDSKLCISGAFQSMQTGIKSYLERIFHIQSVRLLCSGSGSDGCIANSGAVREDFHCQMLISNGLLPSIRDQHLAMEVFP